MEIYLDIETDRDRRLTVIGFRFAAAGVIQLVGSEITAGRLGRELPRGGVLFTYNGHCFDLPCIRAQLGINLREWYDSRDLRWICQRHGLRGGQKLIEQQLGVRRQRADIDGWEAMALWSRHQRGDPAALATLLHYNMEDLNGLVAIKRHLARCALV